jgi:hypothetical protein
LINFQDEYNQLFGLLILNHNFEKKDKIKLFNLIKNMINPLIINKFLINNENRYNFPLIMYSTILDEYEITYLLFNNLLINKIIVNSNISSNFLYLDYKIVNNKNFNIIPFILKFLVEKFDNNIKEILSNFSSLTSIEFIFYIYYFILYFIYFNNKTYNLNKIYNNINFLLYIYYLVFYFLIIDHKKYDTIIEKEIDNNISNMNDNVYYNIWINHKHYDKLNNIESDSDFKLIKYNNFKNNRRARFSFFEESEILFL